MPQQPQAGSQIALGPINVGGDIIHFIPSVSNPTAGANFLGWVDKNALTAGVSGVTNSLAAGAPANLVITAAATSIFSTTFLNMPANSAYEGVPFTVKAAGWLSLNGGTYTATVQPLIYGSTALGFTASAAAAVVSAAAASLTIAVAAAATLTYFPWEAEMTGYASTASGILGGRTTVTVGPSASIAPATATGLVTNSPTSIALNTATTPLNFLVGVVTAGTTISAGVVSLSSFYLES